VSARPSGNSAEATRGNAAAEGVAQTLHCPACDAGVPPTGASPPFVADVAGSAAAVPDLDPRRYGAPPKGKAASRRRKK
jgi:hypothetical protein